MRGRRLSSRYCSQRGSVAPRGKTTARIAVRERGVSVVRAGSGPPCVAVEAGTGCFAERSAYIQEVHPGWNTWRYGWNRGTEHGIRSCPPTVRGAWRGAGSLLAILQGERDERDGRDTVNVQALHRSPFVPSVSFRIDVSRCPSRQRPMRLRCALPSLPGGDRRRRLFSERFQACRRC